MCIEKLYAVDKVKPGPKPKEFIMRNVTAGTKITYNGVEYYVLTSPCAELTVRVTYTDFTTKGVICGGPGPTTRRTNVTIKCGETELKTKPGPSGTLPGEVTFEGDDASRPVDNEITTGGTGSSGQASSKEKGFNTGKPPSTSGNSQVTRILIAEPLTLFAPDKVVGSDGTEYPKGEVVRGTMYIGTLNDWKDYREQQFLSGNIVTKEPIKDSVYQGQRGIGADYWYDTRWGLYSGVYMGEYTLKERDVLEDVAEDGVEKVEMNSTNVVDTTVNNGGTQTPATFPILHGYDPL